MPNRLEAGLPELPEVETIRKGIMPHVQNHKVQEVVIRQSKLRWPVSPELREEMTGQYITSVQRRGKYLLLGTAGGTLLVHLGMSGSLRILAHNQVPQKHDHIDIVLEGSKLLRYTDPRRFGCMLWLRGDIYSHELLRSLGPEPLGMDFSGAVLFQKSRLRKTPVKSFIMDSHVVVGVGNIYANEALFLAGINPRIAAGKIARQRYQTLVRCIKDILQQAIELGGTTLRDFTDSDGKPGYFKQALRVYGRSGLPCTSCHQKLKEIRLGQRSTVYCTRCQR